MYSQNQEKTKMNDDETEQADNRTNENPDRRLALVDENIDQTREDTENCLVLEGLLLADGDVDQTRDDLDIRFTFVDKSIDKHFNSIEKSLKRMEWMAGIVLSLIAILILLK